MTTFSLLWQRDGHAAEPEAHDRLISGLSRLRNEPVSTWSRGPLTLCHFSEDPWVSVSEHPGGFVAILAGRLDSFDELAARLGGPDTGGRKPTDADVLSAAYWRWGKGCLPHLIGDFVALIWDERDRSLLGARDRMGVAPLYYWESNDEVMLAGHVGGLMSHSAIQVRPNEGFVAEVLSGDVTSLTETVYDGVHRIPAGKFRRFDERSASGAQWAPDFSLEVMPWSDDVAFERYRDVLTTAIHDRLRLPVRVGAELSGGLDSSTVATLAAPLVLQRDGVPLRTYSLTFPGMECDETAYIADVAQKAQLDAALMPFRSNNGMSWGSDVAATRDLPMSPVLLAVVQLQALAKANGFAGLLSGSGGDEGFGRSRAYPRQLLLEGRVGEAFFAARSRDPDVAAARTAWQTILKPVLAPAVRRIAPRRRTELPPWVSPSLATETNLRERLTPTERPATTAREGRLRGYQSGVDAHGAEATALASDLAGVAGLHPYLDERVVQFALNLDESHRWSGGQPRAIQGRAMANLLPETVALRRSKADFGHILVDALREAGGRDQFRRMRIARECRWVEPGALERSFDSMERSLHATGVPRGVWNLITAKSVDSWFSTVFDP